jgi:hypothetical protein
VKDIELARELEVWFGNNRADKNKWSRTNTGKVLKAQLLRLGNWKNKKRGKPFKK